MKCMSTPMAEDTRLSRRRLLATSAVVAVAGCSRVESEISGPKYEQGDDLSLTLDVFPEGWKQDNDLNDDYNWGFLNEDETVIVLADSDIQEEVGQAEDKFQSAKNRYMTTKDLEIADESFWAESQDHAVAAMRHSNALGMVLGARQSGLQTVPDGARATKYLQEMFSLWQERHG